MKEEYKEIPPALLKIAYSSAWSIECMEAHNSAGRKVEYIGSGLGGYLDGKKESGTRIYDYYRDNEGAFWFKNRAMLPSGEIVSMERYLFKREGAERKRRYRQFR